jgi:hypothetical protein
MRQTAQKITGRLNMGWALLGGLAVLGTAGCMEAEPADATEEQVDKTLLTSKVILDWNAHTRAALTVATGDLDPVFGTRTFAMVHVAMHDAINSSQQAFERYAYTGRAPGANRVAAAAAAAHHVLVNLFPTQAADLDAKLAASLTDVPDPEEPYALALGEDVGQVILDLRASDNSNTPVGYTPGTGPGRYQFVPPFDGFIYRPGWQFVTPWTLDGVDQFRSDPPPALGSQKYATAYNEVKTTGVLSGSNRTVDQTRYAKFWYEGSDIGWNRVTAAAVRHKGLHLYTSARLFALVNLAMADGFIAGWDSKFHYDFWRPYTAIRAGDTDGNGATAQDAAWEPLLTTPPVQDYPSTHSVLGAAAAAVLAEVLGDETQFTITSSTAEQPEVDIRTFDSFSEAAAENGDSRVRAGIHFRFAVDAGLEMGYDVGEHVVENYLRFSPF